jgi:hypothetical protein
VPATTNPLGVKGCGEAGCAGAMTSVMNAVVDAVSELSIRHFDMHATAPRACKFGVRAAIRFHYVKQNSSPDPSRYPRRRRERPAFARPERAFALAGAGRFGASASGSTATLTVFAVFAAACIESSIISPPFRTALVHAKSGLTNAFAVSCDCLDLLIWIAPWKRARLPQQAPYPRIRASGREWAKRLG